jgi:hypothetical protein
MTAASNESAETGVVPETAAEAEWPPREWREQQRGGGNKGVYWVTAAIFGTMILLVILAVWGSTNG